VDPVPSEVLARRAGPLLAQSGFSLRGLAPDKRPRGTTGHMDAPAMEPGTVVLLRWAQHELSGRVLDVEGVDLRRYIVRLNDFGPLHIRTFVCGFRSVYRPVNQSDGNDRSEDQCADRSDGRPPLHPDFPLKKPEHLR
jgi:hypothetical protein